MERKERLQQARRYLRLLFDAGCDAGLMFAITSLEPLTEEERRDRSPFTRTRYFRRAGDEAAAYCLKQSEEAGLDVYACMGMVEAEPSGGRQGEEDARAISAMWQDFDTFIEGRSKKPYPPTIEDAMRFVNIGPHAPSFVVRSGYGVHGYWLLKEPWTFQTAEERARAKRATHRCYLTFCDRAMLEGWRFDATFDLARIMRVPGTTNHKLGEGRLVELEEPLEERRFEYGDDLEEWLVDERYSTSLKAPRHQWTVRVGYLDIDPKRNLSKKVDALLMNSEEFRRSWHGEAKINDRSPSGYDLSCVNFMVRAGFEDQEIADAIAFRREHVETRGDRKKGQRLDYVQRTIGRVRSDTKPEDILERSDVPAIPDIDHDGDVEPDNLDATTRQRHLDTLKALLRIDVARVVQVGRDDEAQFYVDTRDGRLSIGDVKSLYDFDAVDRKLMTQHDIKLKRKDLRGAWDEVVSLINRVKEVDDTSEPTKVDKLFVHLQQYVADSQPEPWEERGRAVSGGRPFYEEAKVWIHLPDFRRVLSIQREGRFLASIGETTALFKQASLFEPSDGALFNKGAALRGDDKRTRRYYPFDRRRIDEAAGHVARGELDAGASPG